MHQICTRLLWKLGHIWQICGWKNSEYQSFFFFFMECRLRQKDNPLKRCIKQREGVPRSSVQCVSRTLKGVCENKCPTTMWPYLVGQSTILVVLEVRAGTIRQIYRPSIVRVYWWWGWILNAKIKPFIYFLYSLISHQGCRKLVSGSITFSK